MTVSTNKKAIPVAAATAVAACAACCAAAIALPTVALMGAGGILTWFVNHSFWVAAVGAALVGGGWVWAFRRGTAIGSRPSTKMLWLMSGVTLLVPAALAWAWLQGSP